MKYLLEKPGLLALVGCLMVYSLPSEAAIHFVSCPGQSLQAKLDDPTVLPGDTIGVAGTCTENILIRNEKQRLIIFGPATINGPDSNLPTINVRGKGILIQGLSITGGSSGVHVNRGSNAVIDNNAIDSTVFGIQVDQQSFAVITNNAITGNSIGIHVDESSTVRVGYNLATDISASPNIITNNTYGIWVDGNSNAKIAGNTISGNSLTGIHLRHNAHAIIAGNSIGANLTGIFIEQKASVNLNDLFAGPTFLNLDNNSAAGPNSLIGLICAGTGGYVTGNTNAITGANPNMLVSPCQAF